MILNVGCPLPIPDNEKSDLNKRHFGNILPDFLIKCSIMISEDRPQKNHRRSPDLLRNQCLLMTDLEVNDSLLPLTAHSEFLTVFRSGTSTFHAA